MRDETAAKPVGRQSPTLSVRVEGDRMIICAHRSDVDIDRLIEVLRRQGFVVEVSFRSPCG